MLFGAVVLPARGRSIRVSCYQCVTGVARQPMDNVEGRLADGVAEFEGAANRPRGGDESDNGVNSSQ